MAASLSDVKSCVLQEGTADFFNSSGATPLYGIFLFQGAGRVSIDFATYTLSGNTILFSTPWQLCHFDISPPDMRVFWFHADYYCIEYHKKEVACNGLLFNNIYSSPFIQPGKEVFQEIQSLLDKLQNELNQADAYSEAVVRSYLQLILALSSKAKIATLPDPGANSTRHPILQFQSLLEQYYIRERAPSFYAEQLGMPPNTFSKLCKTHFGKSPSELIRERVILEAKKLIHLSYKSMKEIAATLHFDDEHYFSRYFKKYTGIAPTIFRETVGISIAAQSSI